MSLVGRKRGPQPGSRAATPAAPHPPTEQHPGTEASNWRVCEEEGLRVHTGWLPQGGGARQNLRGTEPHLCSAARPRCLGRDGQKHPAPAPVPVVMASGGGAHGRVDGSVGIDYPPPWAVN